MTEQELRAELSSLSREIRKSLQSTESLGNALVDYVLREGPAKGSLSAGKDALELPLTARFDVPASSAASPRRCVTVCVYSQGHEIGCVQVCVQ